MYMYSLLQVKIWFQNRRAKWKRVKAGLSSHGLGRNGASGTKIVVPIPVHVNRFAVRSQHQQMEKMCLSGPKPDLRKKITSDSSGFEKFNSNVISPNASVLPPNTVSTPAAANLSALTGTLALARSIYQLYLDCNIRKCRTFLSVFLYCVSPFHIYYKHVTNIDLQQIHKHIQTVNRDQKINKLKKCE